MMASCRNCAMLEAQRRAAVMCRNNLNDVLFFVGEPSPTEGSMDVAQEGVVEISYGWISNGFSNRHPQLCFLKFLLKLPVIFA